MSLESKISKNVFQGNGTTKTFSFTFRVWKEDQVLVYVGIGDETETDVTSSCSIMLSENGGTVTFPTAPAVGMTIVITRNMPFIQEDQYITGARFDPHEIEDRLDQDCAERQQLLDGVERAVKVPVTSDKTPDQYMSAFWEAVKNVLASIVEAGKNIGNSTYVTSTGSDTPRTLAERFGDIVNVKDFGAKGDGVTDDTAAIQKALDFAESICGDVYFPSGVYIISAMLRLPDFVGMLGNGTKVKSFVDTGPVIYSEGSLYDKIYVTADVKTGVERIDDAIVGEDDFFFVEIQVSSSGDIHPGDDIILFSQVDAMSEDESGDMWCGVPTANTGTNYWSEPLCVHSVKSNSIICTGNLTFKNYKYSADTGKCAYIRKVKFTKNQSIKNIDFEFLGTSKDNTSSGSQYYNAFSNSIVFSLAKRPVVENVRIVKGTVGNDVCHGRGLVFYNCLDFTARHCEISAANEKITNYLSTHTYDNHFTTSACWGGIYDGCVSVSGGQAFDVTHIGVYFPNGEVKEFVRCPSISQSFVNCTIRNPEDSAATNHGGAWGLTYRGCNFFGIARPVSTRSPNTLFDGCRFYGNKIWDVEDYVSEALLKIYGPTTFGTRVTNCFFTGAHAIDVAVADSNLKTAPNRKYIGIDILNNTFYDVQQKLLTVTTPSNAWIYDNGLSSGNYTDYAIADLGIAFRCNTCIACGVAMYDGIQIYISSFTNGVRVHDNTFVGGNCSAIFGTADKTVRNGFYNNSIRNYTSTGPLFNYKATIDSGDSRNAALDAGYLTHNRYGGNVNDGKQLVSNYNIGAVDSISVNHKYVGTLFTSVGDTIPANTGAYGVLDTERRTWRTRVNGTDVVQVSETYSAPATDGTIGLGQPSLRWKNIYAASDAIKTSDEREKQDVAEYPDAVLDAWGEVELRQFLFKDAVKKKGDAARIHAGVVAQQVVQAFKDKGLDATRYGLLCYDRWDDEYETVEVEDAPAALDSEGNEVTPAKTHTEKRLVTAAGSRYGIRYSEALCLEAAYQRRRAQRLEESVSALETRIDSLEALMTNAASKYL